MISVEANKIIIKTKVVVLFLYFCGNRDIYSI